MRARWAKVWAFMCRIVRCAKVLARHQGLPRPLRAMMVLALIPIPGPFDEVVAVLALGVCAVFYRPILVGAWKGSAR